MNGTYCRLVSRTCRFLFYLTESHFIPRIIQINQRKREREETAFCCTDWADRKCQNGFPIFTLTAIIKWNFSYNGRFDLQKSNLTRITSLSTLRDRKTKSKPLRCLKQPQSSCNPKSHLSWLLMFLFKISYWQIKTNVIIKHLKQLWSIIHA